LPVSGQEKYKARAEKLLDRSSHRVEVSKRDAMSAQHEPKKL